MNYTYLCTSKYIYDIHIHIYTEFNFFFIWDAETEAHTQDSFRLLVHFPNVYNWDRASWNWEPGIPSRSSTCVEGPKQLSHQHCPHISKKLDLSVEPDFIRCDTGIPTASLTSRQNVCPTGSIYALSCHYYLSQTFQKVDHGEYLKYSWFQIHGGSVYPVSFH